MSSEKDSDPPKSKTFNNTNNIQIREKAGTYKLNGKDRRFTCASCLEELDPEEECFTVYHLVPNTYNTDPKKHPKQFCRMTMCLPCSVYLSQGLAAALPQVMSGHEYAKHLKGYKEYKEFCDKVYKNSPF